jgi:hypothetical protein
MGLNKEVEMKSDEQFCKDIAAGNSWEQELWDGLSAFIHGIPRPRIAQQMGNRMLGGFSYESDMKIPSSLEAKIRLASSFAFTCADDYPFDSIIVNEVYKTKQDHQTRDEYLCLTLVEQLVYMRPFHSYWIASCDRKHVAVIRPVTKPLWFQKSMWSPKDKRHALNWMCPLFYPNGDPAVLFGRFPEDIKQLLTHL